MRHWRLMLACVVATAAVAMVAAEPPGAPMRGVPLVREDGAVSGRVLFRATAEMTTATVHFRDPSLPNECVGYTWHILEPNGMWVVRRAEFIMTDGSGEADFVIQDPIDYSLGPYGFVVVVRPLKGGPDYATDMVLLYARR
jgi:hypothetical protein